MALSTTSITLAQVKTETGLTSNDLSTLLLSASVNKWGFNIPNNSVTPYTDYQTKFWGTETPESPFPLGAFLGYDHEWRCYAFDTKPALSVNEDDILENIAVGFHYFPAWSESPVGSMTHYFNVYWNTTDSWGSPTTIYIDYPVVNGEDLILPDLYTGSRGLAPDNVTTLGAGDGCYYKIVYSNSSQDRRWDNYNSMNVGDTPGEMVFQVSIGASDWGKFAEIDDVGTFSAYDDGGVNIAISIFRAELSLVWYPATEIEITAEISTDPSFESVDKLTMVQAVYFAEDFTVPRPNELFTLLTDSILPFTVGDTIYARMKISDVPVGIINLSEEWVDAGSTVIVDYLP